MFNYNTSIQTNGFGSSVPSQIAKLRRPVPDGLTNALFGMSPYMKSRINPQQQGEMQRNFDDTKRASSWSAANDLERNFNAANEQMKMSQLGAATNNAMNFAGTAANLQQQNPMQSPMQGLISHLMQGLFSE